MGTRRGVLRFLGWLLLAVLAAPAAAPALAAVLDRGADGGPRLGLFAVALAGFDPFLRGSIRNSLLVATASAAASGMVGVALARALARWEFWGRGPLRALATLPLAVPPAFAAMGLSALFGPEGWRAWAALGWSQAAWGSALVLAVASDALGRVGLAPEDHARTSGAGRGARWRRLVWPMIRPEVSRAVGAVWTLALFEPGAPIVLGLRRTLAFQAVEAARSAEPDAGPRAAALALAATVFALAARALLRRWAGRPAAFARPAGPAPLPRASWVRASAFAASTLAWSGLSLLPAFGVISAAWPALAPGSVGAGPIASGLARPLLDGLAVGLAAVAVGWGALACRPRPSAGSDARLSGVPVLAIGVGALALPGLLVLVGEILRELGVPAPAASVLGILGGWLDPFRTPGAALILATAAARFPILTRASAMARPRPDLADAARALGSGRARAARLAGGGLPPGAILLAVALAAVDPTPALVLTPTDEVRPLGAAALLEASRPGAGLGPAAALAAAGLALNLLALLAARRGGGRPADWLAG